MATESFKTLIPNTDITRNRTNLHEAVPITGTIVSGTYHTLPGGIATTANNIKNPAHGMFQMVFDYPYLSSSANHIFDLTHGYSTASANQVSANLQNSQKQQIYNNMAQVLVGYDHTGSIKEFPNTSGSSAAVKMRDCYFINFARLLGKDEIQPGTFYMDLGVGIVYEWGGVTHSASIRIQDSSGSTTMMTDSPAGEYAPLYVSGSYTVLQSEKNAVCGLIYYQAGIAVITASIFQTASAGTAPLENGFLQKGAAGPFTARVPQMAPYAGWNAGTFGAKALCSDNVNWAFASASIQNTANFFRHRIQNIYFANTTELNSTIYFCRAGSDQFNYSSNPTYLTASQIRVKEVATDQPISFMTTVGLYGADNELLATAKLSEPLKKTPSNEFTLRVRLDY